MKLHILSDLHLEISPLHIPHVEADILILAGDIAQSTKGIDFALSLSGRYEHIIYIAGNHEFYGQDMHALRKEIKNATLHSNIHFLDNEIFHYQGIDFIGTTLWTNFRLYAEDEKFIGACKKIASQGINDFRLIKNKNNVFSVDDCEEMCLQNIDFLRNKLASPHKKIVVSHHCPSKLSIASCYQGDIMNSAFANNLDYLVEKSDLWIHGHTHSSFDYYINKARVVCNPRGYSKHQDKQENSDFKIDLVLDI